MVGLTACGGGDAFNTGEGTGTTPDEPTGSPSSGPRTGGANTIAVTYPVTDAIENLGGGVYRRKGSLIVTDLDGNAVPDGTIVNLNLVDSVIAQGVIDAADSVSGSTLTDATATLGDGVTATALDAAYVYRNDEYRFIASGDPVLLVSADGADKSRIADRTGITANSVNVTDAYTGTYPNATYAAGTTGWLVGASMLGAEVSGTDVDGNLTTGATATVNGVATFAITYPANVSTLMTGCGGVPAIDMRTTPQGAARVFLIASVAGDPTVSAVSDYFCFSRISGGSLSVIPEAMSGNGSITVTYRDGGDKILVPYATVLAAVDSSGGATLTLDAASYVTDESGSFVANVSGVAGASGDTADITFYAEADVIAKVTVTIP